MLQKKQKWHDQQCDVYLLLAWIEEGRSGNPFQALTQGFRVLGFSRAGFRAGRGNILGAFCGLYVAGWEIC
jgi:hypothetical protein